jgi:hypothetical protein
MLTTHFDMTDRNDLYFWGVLLAMFSTILFLKHVTFFEPTGAMCFSDELIYKKNALAFFEGLKIKSAHYPPLYSLVLTPSFFFENWYDMMIRINGLLSTLLAIPVWLLSRAFLNARLSAIAVLLSLMIPFQVIYPAFILSENLFMTFFALAVVLALRGVDAGKFQAAIFGLTLAAAYLTRHLMLPAIPVLIAFWIALPYLTGRDASDFPRIKMIGSNFLIMGLGFVALYSPWLFYTNELDISVLKSMGFGISGLKAPQKNFSHAILWLSAYASYITLSAAPFLLPILLYIFASLPKEFRNRSVSRVTAFALLIGLLTLCYWLVAANHSFSAKYNQVQPKYLIGRYLMFLTPLYIVVGVVTLKRLLDGTLVLNRRRIATAVFLTLTAILTARWILHGQGIWGLPPWFADIEFNSPDAFSYKSAPMLLTAVTGTLTLGGIIWAQQQKNYKLNGIMAAGVVLLICQAGIFANAVHRLPMNFDGLHPRNLAPILLKHAPSNDQPSVLYYDVIGLSEGEMLRGLRFWGTEVDIESLHRLNNNAMLTPPSGPILMLTRQKSSLPELLSYKVGQETFWLYRIDEPYQLERPEIHAYGPNRIQAGRAFNRQPGGASAMWLKTRGATSWTIITFNDHELETVVRSPSFLTAVVPDPLFSVPGEAQVYLKDRLTGHVSQSVIIEIFD